MVVFLDWSSLNFSSPLHPIAPFSTKIVPLLICQKFNHFHPKFKHFQPFQPNSTIFKQIQPKWLRMVAFGWKWMNINWKWLNVGLKMVQKSDFWLKIAKIQPFWAENLNFGPNSSPIMACLKKIELALIILGFLHVKRWLNTKEKCHSMVRFQRCVTIIDFAKFLQNHLGNQNIGFNHICVGNVR